MNNNASSIEQNNKFQKKLTEIAVWPKTRTLRASRLARKTLFVSKNYINRNGSRGSFTKALMLVKNIFDHPMIDARVVKQFYKKLVSLINYVWRTTNAETLMPYYVLVNNSNDICVKNYVVNTITTLIYNKNTWLRRYGDIITEKDISDWDTRDAKIEKEIYSCINDDTCQTQIHDIIARSRVLPSPNTIQIDSFAPVEYNALYNIAQIIGLGFVEANRDWFNFDGERKPISFRHIDFLNRYKAQCKFSERTGEREVIGLIRLVYDDNPHRGGRHRYTRKR